MLLANPVVNPIFSTIRDIARIIEKLAFFLAGRALIRRSISLQCVPTIFTLPTVHKNHLLFSAPLKNKVVKFHGMHEFFLAWTCIQFANPSVLTDLK
tara:strand:- start:2518 stop:2808 length:291 start_codon:yes stop_codon:yes gene_type:complete